MIFCKTSDKQIHILNDIFTVNLNQLILGDWIRGDIIVARDFKQI